MICPKCNLQVVQLSKGKEIWTIKDLDHPTVGSLGSSQQFLVHECGQEFEVLSPLGAYPGALIAPKDDERSKRSKEWAEGIISRVKELRKDQIGE